MGLNAEWHCTTHRKDYPKRALCSCPAALPHLLPGPSPSPIAPHPLPIPFLFLFPRSEHPLPISVPSAAAPPGWELPKVPLHRAVPYRTGAPRLATHQREGASHRLRDALPKLGGRARLAEPLRELPHFRHGDMVRADPSRAGPRRGLLPPSAGRGRARRSR